VTAEGLVKNATGVRIVLNTPFNLIGEPIVNTPTNAFSAEPCTH
jgi:predicted NodU family carbamoyl transferase